MSMDQREEYREFIKQVRPIYLPSANVVSGRALRLKRFKENMKHSWKEAQFTYWPFIADSDTALLWER